MPVMHFEPLENIYEGGYYYDELDPKTDEGTVLTSTPTTEETALQNNKYGARRWKQQNCKKNKIKLRMKLNIVLSMDAK